MIYNLNLVQILGLLGMIVIRAQHNHKIATAGALSFRLPNDRTKATFYQYFLSGMTPAEALAHHDSLFHHSQIDRADASQNPKKYTVYGWFRKWRAENLGILKLYYILFIFFNRNHLRFSRW